MSLNSEAGGHVVGIDIGGTNLRLCLADANGKLAHKWAAAIPRASPPEAVIDQVRKGVDESLAATGIARSSLCAVAAGAPGLTNVDTGMVIATSYLLGWKDVPLRDLLESGLGVPASVENDVKMAAIGESRFGAGSGVRNFVFLAIGTGIGAGIFLNGEVLHGEGWSAGEVGYLIVPGTAEAPADFGEPGQLENVIGGEGIRAQWRAISQENLQATEIFDRASRGDPLAAGVLNRSALLLAYAIRNIAVILNCSLFVLGGTVGLSKPFCDATQRILDERNERIRPRLTRSTLGADAQLMGAVALALNHRKTGV